MGSGTFAFLFCDIEGSTRLLQSLGEGYAAALDAYRGTIRAAITAHGGRELGTEGDSFFVVFESAPAAVRCALQAQLDLPDTMPVRMGIHTGEATEHGDGFIGLAVHQAARVAAAAAGGQVLLTHATRALSDEVDAADLGLHRLKDLDAPVHLYELRHPGLTPGPPPRTLDARPNNLPRYPTPFMGREVELEDVVKLIEDDRVRLVTLIGPGGVGKTRLASEAAAASLDRFRDGVWFVPLAAITVAGGVPSAVAHALGASEVESESAVSAVLGYVAGRRMLIVLDNLEQLDEVGPFVGRLLEAAPDITILTTSRQPLRLSAERLFPVPPLELPGPDDSLEALSRADAIAFFVERARARDPHFVLDASNADAVAEICRRLDGLPLAIELAAARTATVGVQGLLERLRESVTAIGGGPDDAPDRHRTLEAAVGWSYDMLDDRARALLRAASVFAGSFDLEAARSVCDAHLDDITALVERSLLQRVHVSGAVRFGMLETIHAFARAKLIEAGEAEALGIRHAAYFTQLAARAEPEIHGPDAYTWLDRLSADHDNLRAALDASDRPEAAALAASLAEFWKIRGHLEEGRQRLERAIEECGPGRVERARAIIGLARLQGKKGTSRRTEFFIPLLREALETATQASDDRLRARVLYELAPRAGIANAFAAGLAGEQRPDNPKMPSRSRKDRRTTRDMMREAFELAESSGDTALAEEIRASPFFQRGFTRFVRSSMGDPRVIGPNIDAAIERGDRSAEAELLLRRVMAGTDDVLRSSTRALELARGLGDRRLEARALGRLADVARRRKDFPVAVERLNDALQIARLDPEYNSEATVLNEMATVASEVGDIDAWRAIDRRMRELPNATRAMVLMCRLELLVQQARGVNAVIAGLVWAAASFFDGPPRAWMVVASAALLVVVVPSLDKQPARTRHAYLRGSPAGGLAVLAFGAGLLTRSSHAAGVLLAAGHGFRAWRARGVARLIGLPLAAAGLGLSVAAPGRLATPVVILALIALIDAVEREPAANDPIWMIGRAAGGVARTAAIAGGANALAVWLMDGTFGIGAWGRLALPVTTGGLVVFGVAHAALERRFRLAGLLLAAASAALPTFFSNDAGWLPIAAGVAFGLAWVMIGVVRAREPLPAHPEIYPHHLRSDPEKSGADALA